MKHESRSKFDTLPRSLRLALALACTGSTSFALEWDPDPAAGVQSNSGNWNLSEANWTSDGGATNVMWTSVGPDSDAAALRDTAEFSGTDGAYTITLTESFISGALRFTNDGYTLEGDGLDSWRLDLGNSDSNVFLAAGKTGTFGPNLSVRSFSGRLGQAEGVSAGTLNVASGHTYEIRGGASLSMDGLGTTMNVFGVVDTVTGRLNLGSNKIAPTAALITDVTVNVKNGGLVDCNSNAIQIGYSGNYSTDTFKRDGVKGTFVVESGGIANLAEVRLGQFGTGFFEIQAGGTVTATNFVMGNGGAALARLDLEGDLTANFIRMNKPDNVVNFNGGTLIAASADAMGLIWGPEGTTNVRDGGLIIDSNGFDVVVNKELAHSSIDGDMAIDGGLIKQGAGKLTLTEDNSYTGFTDIFEGSLEVGNGGSTGTITAGPTNEGTLIYNRSDDVVIDDDILGDGDLVQAGAGKLTLNAVSSTGDTFVTNGVLELNQGNALDDTSRLTLEGGGAVELSMNETVNELFFDFAPQIAGTWGSTSSAATNTDDSRFSGTGVLTVNSAGVPVTQLWDTDPTPGFQGLSGNWNTTEENWSPDGIVLSAWNPSLPTTFGGVDTTATITVTEDLNPGIVEFLNSGYTLEGDDPARTLTLGGTQLRLGDGTSNSIGSDLLVTRANPLGIGQSPGTAAGSLEILSGGTVETTVGDLNLIGDGTAVSVSGILRVSAGSGRINLGSNVNSGNSNFLTIESGGTVITEIGTESASNNLMQIGFGSGNPSGNEGTVTVKDGGILRLGHDSTNPGDPAARAIRVGQFGTGILNVETNGLVQCSLVKLGNGGSAVGILNLDGGTIETDFLDMGKSGSRAYFNGGILRAMTVVGIVPDVSLIKGADSNGDTSIRNGGLTVDTNGNDKSIVRVLEHSALPDDNAIDGGLTKIGAGVLTLTRTNTYTGPTTVSVGTLELDNGDAIPDGNSLTIQGSAIVELTQNETVDLLFYDSNSDSEPAGTYGSTASAATNKDDSRFSGTGVLTVISQGSIGGSAYSAWAIAKGLDGTPGKENGTMDDPDKDGADNFTEFAFNGDPLSGSDNGLITSLIQDASSPVGDELTLIVAVRDGATFFSDGITPMVVEIATVDGVDYLIEGSIDLSFPNSDVELASGPSDTAPAETGLPGLTGTDWEYWTFTLIDSEGLSDRGFLRASASEAP